MVPSRPKLRLRRSLSFEHLEPRDLPSSIGLNTSPTLTRLADTALTRLAAVIPSAPAPVIQGLGLLTARPSSGSTTATQDGHTFQTSYTYSPDRKLSVNTSVTVPGLRAWDRVSSVVYVYSPVGKLLYQSPERVVQYGPGVNATTQSWSFAPVSLQVPFGSTVKVAYNYSYLGLQSSFKTSGTAWTTFRLV
jgi:hypothetical protein